MNDAPIVVLGGGGHARVLIDALRLGGREILGVAAPTQGALPADIEYLGTDDAVLGYDASAIQLVNGVGSVGNPGLRERLFVAFTDRGYRFACVRHPSAVVAGDVEVGEGAQLMAGAVVQTGSRLGRNVIVNTRASVDHDCFLGEHVHVAPGATLSGGVTVAERCHIGAGAIVLQNIEIGADSVVGAGAVVVRDVPAHSVVMGIPARRKDV